MKPCQATEAELKEQRRRCWDVTCDRSARLETWQGYRYCIRHWLFHWRWSGGNWESKWLDIRTVKLYRP